MSIKQKAPRCPRCGGVLVPDRDLSGRTISVGCIGCGGRIFRGVERSQPRLTRGEIRKGIALSHGGTRA